MTGAAHWGLPPLLLAAWIVLLSALTGEHLVHHLGDLDGHAACDFLAAADHTPASCLLPVVLVAPRLSEEPPAPSPVCSASSPTTPQGQARAPPPATARNVVPTHRT